jgi:hypothetical protein
LKILREFLNKFSILDLRPDATAVKHASGVVAHALSNPGREYAIYLDGKGPTEVTLSLPFGDYKAEWFNTKTGATDKTEDFNVSGDKTLTSPAFDNGIALRLTRAGK